LCEESDAPRPVRLRTSHKWSAGSVVVVGGSPGLTGATLLTAQAALHGGAGAVTLMCPAELQSVYAAQAPGIMTRGVGKGRRFSVASIDEVLSAGQRFDVMVVGPGLGLEVGDFATQLVLRWQKGLLVDADGLNALEGTGALRARQSPVVLTPHAGEFRRLTRSDPSYRTASGLAGETGAVVVLKGNPTFVSGRATWAVTSGGPELATIGTGDVLSGLIAALWARGLDPETAARSGAYWHGRAGAGLADERAVTAAELAVEVGRYAW
jgi:NAD(P)H-hydrate epimerase